MNFLSLLAVSTSLSPSVPAVDLRTNTYAATYGMLRARMIDQTGVTGQATIHGVEGLLRMEAYFPNRIRTRNGVEITDAERVKMLYWRTLDAYAFGANSVSDLREIAEEAPEKIGGYLDAKKALLQMADAIEPAVNEGVVKDDGTMQAVEARLAFWKAEVAPKLTPVLERAMTTLGVEAPPARLQVFVLPATGGREGMTVRAPGGVRIVIGAGKYEAHDFSEVVIHELLHALDTAAPEKGLLAELRTQLKAPEAQEKLPHAVIFTLAASLTREFLDAKHRDVGETHGAYSRGLEKARQSVQGVVEDLKTGKIDRKRAIEAIAAGSA